MVLENATLKIFHRNHDYVAGAYCETINIGSLHRYRESFEDCSQRDGDQ